MKRFLSLLVIFCVVVGLKAQVWEIFRKDGKVDRIPAESIKYVTVREIDEAHEYVDLGLPSGTLWATMNIGATSPEEFGEFFAFGEVVSNEDGKSLYNWNTYKWCNGGPDRLTKYCPVDSLGAVDERKILDLQDVAAYVNWGPHWRMPDYLQLQELVSCCIWTESEMNNVPGFEVKGPNGNTMFLPSSGWYNGKNHDGVGKGGDYWGANVSGADAKNAWGFWFFNGKYGFAIRFPRYFGRAVRPVYVP